MIRLFALLALCLAGMALPAGTVPEPEALFRMRPDHPRLFLNSGDLPALRARAAGPCAKEFAQLKKTVDELPDDAPVIMLEDLFTRLPDGTIKPDSPGRHGNTLFKYNGGNQAVQCALVYLVTGEKKYAEKAKHYIRLANYVCSWCAEDAKIWVGWTSHVQVNMLAAYDWTYNEMTPEERRELLLPMLRYIKKARNGGEYKYRRTVSGLASVTGNYGEDALQWYAGIVAWKTGVDDPLAKEFLLNGGKLFFDMLQFREKISAGSGLLVALTTPYSFSMYPFASFLFLHSWRAAYGRDVAAEWPHMADYINWFDWASIKILPDQKYLTYGLGDLYHHDNCFSSSDMYAHIAQMIHFYAASRPERAQQGYALLARLNVDQDPNIRAYPFVTYLLFNFDPSRIAGADSRQTVPDRYFFAPGFGLLLMRSGTGPDDTFAAFRGGSSQKNHQHYDELSFVIYKRGFLALDSGSRTDTVHHLYYAPQSVAHNTLLIHQEREPMPAFWKPWGYQDDRVVYFNHGGQNSATKAKTLALQSTADFIYIAADATASYSEVKCKEAVRQFVYLRPDIFVVYDRLESVRANQRKEFLLHFQNRPEQIGPNFWMAENGGKLFIRTLLPAAAHYEVVGGPGKEFFASGRNWPVAKDQDWQKRYLVAGAWRLEVSDPQPATANRFLHFLQAALPGTGKPVEAAYTAGKDCDEINFTDPDGVKWTLSFRRTGEVGLHIRQVRADGTVAFDAGLPNRLEPKSLNAVKAAGQ